MVSRLDGFFWNEMLGEFVAGNFAVNYKELSLTICRSVLAKGQRILRSTPTESMGISFYKIKNEKTNLFQGQKLSEIARLLGTMRSASWLSWHVHPYIIGMQHATRMKKISLPSVHALPQEANPPYWQ